MKGDEANHLRPAFLADGRHFLYRVQGGPNAGYYVTELGSKERTHVLGADVGNVAVARGRLLFLRESTLLAQPFDMRQLALTGEAVPVAEQIGRYGASGVGSFSASDTVLAYYAATETAGSRLVWLARDGTRLEAVGERGRYADLNLSPDGKQALVSDTRDIWLVDVARGLRTRFTFDATDERQSVWLPDGRRVVFESGGSGQRDLYQKASNLSGTEQLLYSGPLAEAPLSVSPDGRFLLYSVGGRETTSFDLWILPLSASAQPNAFAQTSFNEREGNFSPDGRWIAYTSNESGAEEVYVAPFPGPGGKRQISAAGGSFPRWRRDGKEIYFLDADERLTAVSVSATSDGFDVGPPQPLFVVRRGGERRVYDVSPDGQRFLVNMIDEQAVAAPVNVVVNWAAGQGR
jgi:dipeptidyl aminopeptidase/acylaminoacyl peptidase